VFLALVAAHGWTLGTADGGLGDHWLTIVGYDPAARRLHVVADSPTWAAPSVRKDSTVFRIPPGAGQPRHPVPTHDETLREFDRPVAVLARPEPGWTILLGREGTDGHLTDVDIQYAHQRTYRVRVRTTRPAPPNSRTKASMSLEDILGNTIANFSDEDDLDPTASVEALLNPAPATPGEALPRLDGQEYTARTATRSGFFAALLEIGDQAVAVAAPEELKGIALDLTWIRPGQPLQP
jgi:hypothetical protein